jgi:ER lumen protein retaining receptor
MLFRIAGDMLHVASRLLLAFRIRKSKNCVGISCKTQELYMIVFMTRYLDLFAYFVSFYNTFMKLAYLAFTGYLIYLMRFSKLYRQTYDVKGDSFAYWKYLLGPCFVLALLVSEFSLLDITWSFSIFLEAVAFVPQLDMMRKMKEVENLTSHYVFCLGAYRLLYIMEWTSKYLNDEPISMVSVSAGVVQIVLHADFFYYYILAKLSNKPNVALPI